MKEHQSIQDRPVTEPIKVICKWEDNEEIPIRKAREIFNSSSQVCAECRACQK